MIETILELIGLTVILLAGVLIGGNAMADDAEARLKGQKPVDAFWRKRGMK